MPVEDIVEVDLLRAGMAGKSVIPTISAALATGLRRSQSSHEETSKSIVHCTQRVRAFYHTTQVYFSSSYVLRSILECQKRRNDGRRCHRCGKSVGILIDRFYAEWDGSRRIVDHRAWKDVTV